MFVDCSFSITLHNDCKGVTKYIQSAFDFLKIDSQLVDTGNSNIDSIINYKLQEMQQKNIETEYSVVIPDKLKIRDFDINIVMGNLLNNAMEAMEKIKHKKFFLDISFEKNILFIHMENTYNGKEKKKGEIFLTTKSNKKIHGIGLKSIENVLEKYDGDIIYCPDKTKGVFKVDVMLCNKEIN